MGFLKNIIISLVKLSLAFTIVFGLAFWWIGRDVKSLNQFCVSIRSGASILSLGELAKKHSINHNQFDKDHSIYNNKTQNWLLIVPSNNTMGEFACFITHDGVNVISSKMDEP